MLRISSFASSATKAYSSKKSPPSYPGQSGLALEGFGDFVLASNAGPGQIRANLAEQLDLYDQLPAELKCLIDQAPREQDVREVWQVWKIYGAKAAGLIEAEWTRQFPGWKVEPANLKKRRAK